MLSPVERHVQARARLWARLVHKKDEALAVRRYVVQCLHYASGPPQRPPPKQRFLGTVGERRVEPHRNGDELILSKIEEFLAVVRPSRRISAPPRNLPSTRALREG